MVEAGEGCREVEKKEGSKWVFLESAADGRVHVDDVGGNVSVIEEAALFRAAELVGDGG